MGNEGVGYMPGSRTQTAGEMKYGTNQGRGKHSHI